MSYRNKKKGRKHWDKQKVQYESQPSHTESNRPPILEAQVTLIKEETEPSADHNLIRVWSKFKTALVY